MNIKTLNILSDAISEVGAWDGWYVKDDMVHIEFCDIMLYDESKGADEARTTDALAVRFYGHAFAVFLDNLSREEWYEHFCNTDSVIYEIDTYELAFDDAKEAASLLNDYQTSTVIKDFEGEKTLGAAGHLLCARCGDVGFIAGGDEIRVIGKNGEYTAAEIETGAAKWWDYWKEYWKRRGSNDAYPKDYACEVTIPVRGD